jgi:hypothetical protein
MTRRQLAVLKQSKLLPHLTVAALSDSDDRVILYQPERLAPNLKPIRGAALI